MACLITNAQLASEPHRTKLHLHIFQCEKTLTDGGMESSNAWKVADPIQVPVGPITRARAKKFKEALNGLIYEIWNQVNLCKPIDQGPCQSQRYINEEFRKLSKN